MILTPENFQKLCPVKVTSIASNCLHYVNRYHRDYGIDTKQEAQMFLANAFHESYWFTDLTENLNYSATDLLKYFKAYRLAPLAAVKEAGKPELIANRAYANRVGNGDRLSGDGWRYRGRGIFQETFRDNYMTESKLIFGDDRLVKYPEMLEQPEWAVKAALHYWKRKHMEKAATFKESVEILNGGLNGYTQRLLIYQKIDKYVICA